MYQHFFFLIFVSLSQSQTYPELQEQALCAIGNALSLTNMCDATFYCSIPIQSIVGLMVHCDDHNTVLNINVSSLSSIPTQIGFLTILRSLAIEESINLSGTIPSEIGKMTSLLQLTIAGNPFLSGTIPSEIGELSSLTELTIAGNPLSGTIPSEIGKMFLLRQLTISDIPFLWGTIPSEIGNMTSLIQLIISGNSLLSGTIPSEIGELTLLYELSISEPLMSGTIPSEIGKIVSLQQLDFSGNLLLSGTIPSEIGKMSYLQLLSISETLVSGTIPSEIGKIYSLQQLDISSNPLLSGTIPSEIWNMTSLQQLSISITLMSGTIPSDIGKLTLLIQLEISNNPLLSGIIPSEIGNLSLLTYLEISNNPLLSGIIPSEIGNLFNLLNLKIYNNPNMSGIIPSEIGKLSLLTQLFLRENGLSGSIPSELANCPLIMLYLSNNYLSVLPNVFPSATLQELDVSFNNLSGPLNFGHSLSVLNILDLSYNLFSGQIQEVYFESATHVSVAYNSLSTLPSNPNLIHAPLLLSIDFSHNLFTGTIPSYVGLFTTLKILKFQDNQFSGTITDALSRLYSLEELYLNNNNFIGTIPTFLPSQIQILNLQSNNLSGTIPGYLGKFKYLNSIDLSNLNICGCYPSEWANINWLSCTLTGVYRNCSCNDIPSCDLRVCDPTINCEIDDPCNTRIAKCSRQRSCSKNGFGYTCGNCPSSYTESDLYNCTFSAIYIVAIIIPILVLITIVIGIVSWKKYNTPTIEIELPNSWFWDYERITNKNYQKSKTEPAYYYTNVKERSKEKQYLDELMEKLDFGNITIDEAIAVVSPVLAANVSGAHQIQKSRVVKNPLQFNKKDWEEKDNADICQNIITIFESKMKAFSWNETIENYPVIPVVHGTDEDIAWKIASGGFAALSTLDTGFYGKGIYFSSSALYTLPYFGVKKKPTILICLTIPGNPYPVTEDPSGPIEHSLIGEHIKSGYQSHYAVTKKNGIVFRRDDYDTDQKQYDELVISQEAQVVPIFLLKVSDINLDQLVAEYKRDISGQKGQDKGHETLIQ